MSQQTLKLGRLEAVYGVSPVYLQRALIVIVVSFIFFFVMLIAFSLRQNIGYFLLATAFLIVKLFTLFGWMMQRKKVVTLYENGLMIGKQACRYDEIEKVTLQQSGKSMGSEKVSGEIVKTSGEKIVLPEAIHQLPNLVARIEQKVSGKP